MKASAAIICKSTLPPPPPHERHSTSFLTEENRLINFGSAIASHNCSAAARLIMRAGLKATDLPDTNQRAFTTPSIWQYAQKAGFQTILVDTFVNVFGTHSYMTKSERSFIDHGIPVDESPAYLRDQKIATEILPALLAHEDPLFIYVNKYGAHFPYRTSYPPTFENNGQSAEDDLSDRDKLVESYRRALRWSTDEFFRNLLERVDLKDTLILYTSDHGQSLLEGNYKLTHCSTGEVHHGEGIVPLFALTGDSKFGHSLRQSAPASFGKATHFEIFPTLLLAMGYDESWIIERYGLPLTRPLGNNKRRFLTGDIFNTTYRGVTWIDAD